MFNLINLKHLRVENRSIPRYPTPEVIKTMTKIAVKGKDIRDAYLDHMAAYIEATIVKGKDHKVMKISLEDLSIKIVKMIPNTRLKRITISSLLTNTSKRGNLS